ncbi:MAG: DUF2911 domain-containing protein [Flavobacteriaceae bacterium]
MRKKTLARIAFLLVSCSSISYAQDMLVSTKVSQKASVMQRIGTTDVTVSYSSPLAKGRKIFGGIVPYDFIVDGVEYPWRAGSNENTTVEFSHDVWVEGMPLKKGKYGLHIFVKEKEWTFIFSNKNDSWGSFSYKKEEDALRVSAVPQKTDYQEWLSYEFEERLPQSSILTLHWTDIKCSIKIATNVNANALADLKKKEEKSADDYIKMAQLTVALDEEGIDEALGYIDESLKIGQGFRNKILKAELLLEKGMKVESEKWRKEAFAEGQGFPYYYYYPLSFMLLEGNKDKTYELLNAMLTKDPDNWIANLAMGEYYIKQNNQEKATFHFGKAYEFAGERSKNYTRYMYLSNQLILENSR